jgi:diguanylate cyclase
MVSIALISRVVFFIMDGFEMVPMGSSSGKMVVVLSMIGVGMCTILIGTYLMTNELLREDIARIAEQDSLTGIPNRRALMDRSRKLVEMAAKKRESLMVLMCDIDHFKKINDTFGHAEGDRTIKDVANIVASICSRLDPEKAAIGRYGGEEFCVVTRGMSDSQAEAFSKTLVEMTRRADRRDDRPKVTMSAGAVLFNSASRHSRELLESALKTADDALYRSKREGRDRWTLVVES